MDNESVIVEKNERLYVTSRAYIVESPSEVPRELAAAYEESSGNGSFVWIAGRYVQGNNPNKNGHFWSTADLESGRPSIKYTPLNLLHKFQQPVGVIVDTKMVVRDHADDGGGYPEIQALSVVWAANFPQVAKMVREFHDKGQLWYSMECVAEKVQCMTCDLQFAYASAAHETCEHLSTDRKAPRRFINPTFLGGALIFPPTMPGWADADITQVANLTVGDYVNDTLTAEEWEHLMGLLVS